VDMLPEDDCASRVLPAICPALIDKEKRVEHDQDQPTQADIPPGSSETRL